MTFGAFKALFGVSRANDMIKSGRLLKLKNATDAGSDVICSAEEAAKHIGFKPTKDIPKAVRRKTQGMPIFKKGNKYISPSNTDHHGEFWKLFDNKGNKKNVDYFLNEVN